MVMNRVNAFYTFIMTVGVTLQIWGTAPSRASSAREPESAARSLYTV